MSQPYFDKMMKIFPSLSKPYNATYSEWSKRWWRWIHSIPMEINPGNDITGINADQNQNVPNVWFLAGTFGGSVRRTCTIPPGKGIFFPVITSAFVLDKNLETESELEIAAKTDMDRVKEMVLTVDNDRIEHLEDYRIRTEPFDDIVAAIPTKVVSDGYWIFFEPLLEGDHSIYFRARNVDFFTEVTYNILIHPKN